MIPTKEQNKKGLHQKYHISRTDGQPIDPENEYFILKVAGKGDQKHIEACRKAVIAYAVNIEPHFPELAKDLIDKYGS